MADHPPHRRRASGLARGIACTGIAVSLVLGPSAAASSRFPPPVRAASYTTAVQAFMTLYGYADNSPPGTVIAHPCLHAQAGGTGTYADPVTFATDIAELPWCAIIYVPYMERYFIHEDECSQCDTTWVQDHRYRFDMWAGGDAASRSQPERGQLLRCESTWTRAAGPTDPADPTVQVDPPSGLPVVSAPIFSAATGCWQPITVGNPGDQANQLGSPVRLPVTGTDSSPGMTLGFSASGLPAGLSIDAATGVITGTPTVRERTRVTVTAADTLTSASVSFHWVVKRPHR